MSADSGTSWSVSSIANPARGEPEITCNAEPPEIASLAMDSAGNGSVLLRLAQDFTCEEYEPPGRVSAWIAGALGRNLDGEWVVTRRASKGDYVTRTGDGGLTWSEPTPIP